MRLDFQDIIISAPGKVILHGEHAVVYKKRALAASLDLRTYLRLRVGHGDEINVSLPDIDVSISWSKEKLESSLDLPLCAQSEPVAPSEQILEQLKDLAGLNSQTTDTKSLALVAFLYLFCSISPKDNKLPSVDLHLSSRLPPSAGLGSSAAYSVCLATGLLEVAGVLPCPDASHPTVSYSAEQLDLINRWAFQAEKVIHGNPSGIDNAISTHGGALCFQAGAISPIAKVPKLDILLTNTKVPRSTKVLVAGVKEKYKKFPGIIEPVIDSIEAITTKCEEVFKEMEDGAKEEHFDVLKELVSMNQRHLAVLGVSHPTLEAVCHVTAEHNLQSKLTGAGGGGCALTLLTPATDPTVVSKVKEELTQRGFVCWETAIGGLGVQRIVEKSQLEHSPANFKWS